VASRYDLGLCRRSAIQCLENARVPQSEAAQVVGHERAGITFGVYNPEGLELKALREIIEKVRYRRQNLLRLSYARDDRGGRGRPFGR
jgi:hypothetical protein